MQRILRNPPLVLLIGAAGVAAATLLALTAGNGMSYFADTWDLLINRRDPSVDSILTPHNEHLVAIPVIVEQIFLRVFGMSSAAPEYVLLTAILITTAVLLYVYVKRRVGPWPALFAAVLLLFFGPAWEVLLWGFEITFCGPMMCGLAMLLALEREDLKGDVAACAFLVLAFGFSSLGLPLIFAAFVAILLGPRETWLRRSYVFAVPALLFAAWYLGWGRDAETHITLHNVFVAPRYVLESLANALGSLVGLGPNPTAGYAPDPAWGRVLLVALVIGVALYKLRHRDLYRGLWPVAAAAAANWLLTAFNAIPGREPTASRYQYASAIFIMLILANLFKGARIPRGALVAMGAATLLALGPNLVQLKSGADYLDAQTALTRADTAAIEIARGKVADDFQLDPEVAGTPALVNVYAGAYLEAVEEYGSPAYSIEELESAHEPSRGQADVVLAAALPVELAVERDGFEQRRGEPGCIAVGGPGGKPEVALGPGTSTISMPPGAEATVALRRFAEGSYPVALGEVPGGSTAELTIPGDVLPAKLWHLRVEGDRAATVCGPFADPPGSSD